MIFIICLVLVISFGFKNRIVMEFLEFILWRKFFYYFFWVMLYRVFLINKSIFVIFLYFIECLNLDIVYD